MPTKKEIQAYATSIKLACDVATRNTKAYSDAHDPRSAKEKKDESVDYSCREAENTTTQIQQIQTLARNLSSTPTEKKLTQALAQMKQWENTPSSDNDFSVTSILTEVMPFESIESPIQARQRHLQNITHAIQDLERRLLNAGAKDLGTRTTPTDNRDLSESDTFLATVQILIEQAQDTLPQNDQSMESFTSACNNFVAQTSGNLSTYSNPIANHQSAYDYLMECINPLLEYFGYEPCKTTSFKNSLNYLKNEAETMQDEEQISKTKPWNLPEI